MAGLSCVSFAVNAQDPAAFIAEKEAAEERAKAINARMDGLEETLAVVRKHVSRLENDLRNLRDELTRLNSRNNDTATKESLERLAKSIEEVDRKRQADNDKVLAALTALQKGVEKGVAPERSRSAPVNPPPAPRSLESQKGHSPTPPTPMPDNGTGQWFEYTIKDRDTLSGIVAKMRKLNYKVTQKQMEDANPGVDWNRLKIGNTLKIYAQPPQ